MGLIYWYSSANSHPRKSVQIMLFLDLVNHVNKSQPDQSYQSEVIRTPGWTSLVLCLWFIFSDDSFTRWRPLPFPHMGVVDTFIVILFLLYKIKSSATKQIFTSFYLLLKPCFCHVYMLTIFPSIEIWGMSLEPSALACCRGGCSCLA